MHKNSLVTLLIYSTIFVSASNVVFAEEQLNESVDVVATDNCIIDSRTSSIISKNKIMGDSEVSPDAFKRFFSDMSKTMSFKYKLNCSIDEFVDIVFEEASIENVRADIVIAQAIEETGYFQFGGIVKPSDNNFAGIGATGASGVRAKFSSPRVGIRAQVQHLKAYASKDSLVNSCVDPRFKYVTRGSAVYLEDLAGKWAVPGYNKSKYSSLDKALKANDSYGQNIYKIIEKAKTYNTSFDVIPSAPCVSVSDNITLSASKSTGIVTARSLNVRKGAGTNYSVITSIKKNTTVTILSTKNGWYNVELPNGKKGWVSKEYVSIKSNSSTASKTGTVTARSLNVRKGAGTKYSVIASIKKNTKVTILGSKNNWYKVQLSNGKTGWVYKKYVAT